MASFWLRNLWHEDEAENTGMRFEELPGGKMKVSLTFHFPEYEELSPPMIASKSEARELWRKSVASGKYAFEG